MRIKRIDFDCRMFDLDSELSIDFIGTSNETYQIYRDINNGKTVNLECSLGGVKVNKPSKRVNLNEIEVIFQDDATVLKANGKVYVSRPEKGEKYDREKGLLVCLMKSLGLTTSKFLSLIENAKVCGKTVKNHKKNNKKGNK